MEVAILENTFRKGFFLKVIWFIIMVCKCVTYVVG